MLLLLPLPEPEPEPELVPVLVVLPAAADVAPEVAEEDRVLFMKLVKKEDDDEEVRPVEGDAGGAG
jgi:hypothetical protein